MLATDRHSASPGSTTPTRSQLATSGPSCRLEERQQWHEAPVVEAYPMDASQEVARCLDAHADSCGNSRVGWAWIEEQASGFHTRALLTPVSGDLLLVETQSEDDAGRTREWLQRAVGQGLVTADAAVVRIGSVPDDWR